MKVRIFAVPYDCGLEGVRMGAGPAGMLGSGLAEHLEGGGHEVTVTTLSAPEPAHGLAGETQIAFSILGELARSVRSAALDGEFPLVLGGPCYSAVGTVSGLGPERTGVIWFDAHGDFNTPETTISGLLDGMGTAILTGRCWRRLAASVSGFSPVPEAQLLWVGVRDLDPLEEEEMKRSAATFLSPTWARASLDNALATLRDRVDEVYVHVDPDVLDEAEGRANFLSAPGGLTLEETQSFLVRIGATFRVTGMALASYDPLCDQDGRICRAAFAMFDNVLDGLSNR